MPNTFSDVTAEIYIGASCLHKQTSLCVQQTDQCCGFLQLTQTSLNALYDLLQGIWGGVGLAFHIKLYIIHMIETHHENIPI